MRKIKTIILLSICCNLWAQPVVHLDFDMSGRPFAEGNEPGFTQWVVEETTSSVSRVVNGISFTLSRHGGAGTRLRSVYYKAGVQAPNFARLIGDAIYVPDGDAGANLRVSISGLPAGQHTLQAYHNSTDANQHSPMRISVNGAVVIANQAQTSRRVLVGEAASSFISFQVLAGQTVHIDYASLRGASFNNIFLNNLSLNQPNPRMQAGILHPKDRDWQVAAESGRLVLSWSAGSMASTHDIYLGTDSATLVGAGRNSAEFMGNQVATTYSANNLSVHKFYWWRVDQVTADGRVTKGNLWSFSPRRLAFPGAEGYGRFARGGRGGKVVKVTNLNDDGPGSLRHAITNDIGPRTIIFDVSGIITLRSRLSLTHDFVTLAGQTAPGNGIVVRSAPFGMSGASHVVFRFVKVRLGYGITADGLGMAGSNYSIVDHSSISWTIDEAFSSRNAKNITLQRTLIAEALNIADHNNYPAGSAHGFAATISGDTGSFHHNLLANNAGRNWSLGGGLDGNGNYAGKLDIFNNVVFNWDNRTTDGGAQEVNFVNNYYKKGPSSRQNWALNAQWDGFPGYQTYYCSGNIVTEAYPDPTRLRNGCTASSANPRPWTDRPWFASYARVQSAVEAYKDVLSDVGANMPVLDHHDSRIIRETITGVPTFRGSISGKAGLPDRESDVGGFGNYPALARSIDFDSDNDGLPNWYETYIGTNLRSPAGDFSDANRDAGKGYTNLEEYLHWMATPHKEVDLGGTISFNFAALFRGYTMSPRYRLVENPCFSSTIRDSTLVLVANSTCGLQYLSLSVTDGENHSKNRDIGVFVKESSTVPNTTRKYPVDKGPAAHGGKFDLQGRRLN